MKRLIKIVAVVLVLVVSMSLLTACGGINLTDASSTLSKAGYIVALLDSTTLGSTDGSINNLMAMQDNGGSYYMVVIIEYANKYALGDAETAILEQNLYEVVTTKGLYLIYGDQISVDLIL